MIEDSVEEFLTTSSKEGGFGLPSPKRRGMRAPPAAVITTPWMKNALATQALSNAALMIGGNKCKPMSGNLPPSKRQRYDEAS
jgi:hypothetical protein